jgi:NAD(P)-dependent dehydrogenase (short-subunit alcohol dehydrogenase family)
MSFDGKVALVTGSTQGIGRSVVRQLLSEGAIVFVTGRSAARAQEAAAELSAEGGVAFGLGADVTVEEEVKELIAAVESQYSRVDVLVNNAGGSYPAPYRHFFDYTPESFRAVVRLNLTSQFLLSRNVVPIMKRQGGGSIVNVSSLAAVSGVRLLWSPAYCAAKAGVIGLTKQMALELGQYGIRVNAIAQADTVTERTGELAGDSAWPETMQEMEARYARHPIQRMATAAEIASGIVFLASDRASYVTGETLLLTGGSYIAP